MVLTEAQVAALEKASRRKKRRVRSRPSIRAIWAHRTPTMSAQSRAWVASTSRPSLTLTAKWCLSSCMIARTRW
jgi:hypothetical protein